MVESLSFAEVYTSPPFPRAGSQKEGMGTFYSQFTLLRESQPIIFRLKGLTNENISLGWASTPTWTAPRACFPRQLLWAAGLTYPAPCVAPAHPAELAFSKTHQLRGLALQRFSGRVWETSSPVSSLTRGTVAYIFLTQEGFGRMFSLCSLLAAAG